MKVGSILSIFSKYPKYKQGKSGPPRRSLKRNTTTQLQTIRPKKLKKDLVSSNTDPGIFVNNETIIQDVGAEVKRVSENDKHDQKKFQLAALAYKTRQIPSLKRNNRRLKSKIKILRATIKELRRNYNVASE